MSGNIDMNQLNLVMSKI